MPWSTSVVSELRTAHRPVAEVCRDFGVPVILLGSGGMLWAPPMSLHAVSPTSLH
jgi:hypothetical protein